MSVPKPKPVPASCVIKRVIIFGNGAHTYKTDFKSQRLTRLNKMTVAFEFILFLHFFFAFHCMSAAQPAAVQQLQGLHEAQAQLSSCVRQGVHVGGKCKLTVKRVHLKQKKADVQLSKSGS